MRLGILLIPATVTSAEVIFIFIQQSQADLEFLRSAMSQERLVDLARLSIARKLILKLSSQSLQKKVGKASLLIK